MTARKDSAHESKNGAPNFVRYDNRRFAVLLGGHAAKEPLRGTAHFERDQELGNVLRIDLDGDLLGSPVIVVCERDFSGLILPDESCGCDYRLVLVNERNDNDATADPTAGQNRRCEGAEG